MGGGGGGAEEEVQAGPRTISSKPESGNPVRSLASSWARKRQRSRGALSQPPPPRPPGLGGATWTAREAAWGAGIGAEGRSGRKGTQVLHGSGARPGRPGLQRPEQVSRLLFPEQVSLTPGPAFQPPYWAAPPFRARVRATHPQREVKGRRGGPRAAKKGMGSEQAPGTEPSPGGPPFPPV